MTVQEIKNIVVPILTRHQIVQAGLFGSVARNEASSTSDVDILVEFGNPMSLLNYVGVKLELEEKLGRKVDLVEYKAIKPSLKKNILNDYVRIV